MFNPTIACVSVLFIFATTGVAWGQKSENVLFVSDRGDGETFQIYMMAPDGSNQRIVKSQIIDEAKSRGHWKSQRHVHGEPGNVYTTAIACLVLAMPQRRLPMWAEETGEGDADARPAK